MATEQYSIGYEEGYQAGWNAAMESLPAPVQPAQQQEPASNCNECANADSWGMPDKPCCRACRAGSHWSPLNKTSINPNKPALAEPPAQPAQHQCKFPLCHSKEYQQAIAEQIKRELYTGEPAQQEPCGWQFFQDGKWHNGMETNNHRANTEAAGVPVRDVYPSPQAQPSKTLNWEPIQEFWRNNSSIDWDELEAAIEAAHGIKGDA